MNGDRWQETLDQRRPVDEIDRELEQGAGMGRVEEEMREDPGAEGGASLADHGRSGAARGGPALGANGVLSSLSFSLEERILEGADRRWVSGPGS